MARWRRIKRRRAPPRGRMGPDGRLRVGKGGHSAATLVRSPHSDVWGHVGNSNILVARLRWGHRLLDVVEDEVIGLVAKQREEADTARAAEATALASARGHGHTLAVAEAIRRSPPPLPAAPGDEYAYSVARTPPHGALRTHQHWLAEVRRAHAKPPADRTADVLARRAPPSPSPPSPSPPSSSPPSPECYCSQHAPTRRCAAGMRRIAGW